LEGPRPGSSSQEAIEVAVLDPDSNRVELIVPSSVPLAASASTVAPRRLGHVVLWTGNVNQQEAFYALLGFQVTDRTHMGMSFLRCNADHHSLAIMHNDAGRRGLQHVAFDVSTVDEVMREYARLNAEGVKCIGGVGRHGPGNNIFSYYRDPVGNVVEFYGEMEKVPQFETAEPRFWGSEHKGDSWGVAGPPPPILRGEAE
jgi:catechol-2,3-dioxygenase